MRQVRVLFVCLGNICRSPTAEGIFRQLVNDQGLAHAVAIDSAGTGHWHVGKAPDRRACGAAVEHGYAIEDLRARQVSADDFDRFDYILAMDRQNLADLEAMRPPGFGGHLGLLLDFGLDSSPEWGHREVPDPYYGGDDGFQLVVALIRDACHGLLAHMRDHHGIRAAR